jgi:hypothetical protein
MEDMSMVDIENSLIKRLIGIVKIPDVAVKTKWRMRDKDNEIKINIKG